MPNVPASPPSKNRVGGGCSSGTCGASKWYIFVYCFTALQHDSFYYIIENII
jgi:hypothetical protein